MGDTIAPHSLQNARLLFEGPEWDYDKLRRVYEAVEEIALNDLGLDISTPMPPSACR
jgi:hypothetical protein